MDNTEEETNKGFTVLGRDISQIPCFRTSFLYGIGGGVVIGCVAFLGTSRARLSTHIGFSSFCCSTLGYWLVCRYQWSKRNFENLQLQAAIKNHAMYEGTEVESELLKSDLKSA